jgi:hypothetical protein
MKGRDRLIFSTRTIRSSRAKSKGLSVAKYKWGAYAPDPGSSSWVKIKNPAYSQAAGRHEQFTRYRRLAL